MRLSKEERETLRFVKREGGFISSTYPFFCSSTTSNLIKKGILEAKVVYSFERIGSYSMENNYRISLSESGHRLLQEHPELLQYNALTAFLSRSCTFIKEHFVIALCAIICVFLVLLITILTHG